MEQGVVMENTTSQERSQQSFRATSEGPAPLPRSSREDGDASVTRKRPRLDSGDRTIRSLSAGPSPLASNIPSSQRTIRRITPERELQDINMEQQGTPSPHSRVTLNIKEQSRPAGTNYAAEQSSEVKDEIPESPHPSYEDIPEQAHRSPSGSPLIEVADPEDMNGTTGHTVWRKPGEKSIEDCRAEVMDMITALVNVEDPKWAMNTIYVTLAFQDDDQVPTLTKLADFVEEWLKVAESHRRDMWDLWNPDSDFWKDFVEMLMPNKILHDRTEPAAMKFLYGKQQIDLTGDDSRETSFIKNHKRQDHDPTLRLFFSMVGMTCKVLAIDRQTLIDTSNDPSEPDLGVKDFLKFFNFYTRDDQHLSRFEDIAHNSWKARAHLRYIFGYDRWTESELRNGMMKEFFAVNGLDDLVEVGTMALTRTPLDLDYAITTLTAADSALGWIHSSSSRIPQSLVQSTFKLVAKLFYHFHEIFPKIIKQQASGFSVELISNYIIKMADCASKLASIDYRATLDLLPSGFEDELLEFMENRRMDHSEPCELVRSKVRLDLCLLCMKFGRMESRVAGVDCCATELVQAYQLYYVGKETQPLHPVIAFSRSFIQKRGLISYLFGVDSHLQIVTRSFNIIGFQVITHHWTAQDTDLIWNRIRTSQDQAFSDAILNVLKKQTGYADTCFFMTFVAKLNDLPPEAFDGELLNFADSLIQTTIEKANEKSSVQQTCLDLLVPILHKTFPSTAMSASKKSQVYKFVLDQISKILRNHHFPVPEQIKANLCLAAAKGIAEDVSTSTANIALLGLLFEGSFRGHIVDGKGFFITPEFAKLLVLDLSRLSEVVACANLPDSDVSTIMEPRTRLLHKALLHIPNWPGEPMMQSLWQNLVGSGAYNNETRAYGWHFLGLVTNQAVSLRRLSFLDACIETYLPRLEPQYMIYTIHEFIKDAIPYYEKYLRRELDDSNEEPLPGDMLWDIALQSLDNRLVNYAIHNLVLINIDNVYVRSPHLVEANHARLVERCVEQLTQAATEIKANSTKTASVNEDAMITSPATQDNQADLLVDPTRLRFVRILAILNQFLIKVRERRLGSPVVRNDSPLSNHSITGEEMKFTYYDPRDKGSKKRSEIRADSLSTLEELAARICRRVDLSEIRIFINGQVLDTATHRHEKLKDVALLNGYSKHLLVTKPPQSTWTESEMRMLPLEKRVMTHFPELYDLLDLQDSLGQDACKFLMTFPANFRILSDSAAGFLSLQPFQKTVYCCYALQSRLDRKHNQGESSADDLKFTVQEVGHALIQLTTNTTPEDFSSRGDLLYSLTSCLEKTLKEALPDDCISEPVELVQSALWLLQVVNKQDGIFQGTQVVQNCFSIALEASIKEPRAWETFKSYPQILGVLFAVWLETPHFVIRRGTTGAVKSICAGLPELPSTNSLDFLRFFWQQMTELIPQAQSPSQSKHFFLAVMDVFRLVGTERTSDLPLNDYITSWSGMLLRYRPKNQTPYNCEDDIVDGLTELLRWAISLVKSEKQDFDSYRDLPRQIFASHLFPQASTSSIGDVSDLLIPVLSSSTRNKLYELVLSTITDQSTFDSLLRYISKMIPNGETLGGYWTNGVATITEEQITSTWAFDRDAIVRAKNGYAGLRNLSNTCYLNSLFEQLYMNIRLRDFFLQLDIGDSDKSQVLLGETQRLFAWQQDTWLKCVDPSNVIEQIVTYDGEPIDPQIQMDADEFYNLLFDRWESQLSTEDKEIFRKFYGGELVQQIKSQDCEHISERKEPFFVIQCDIQGKTDLNQSLNAFVEGEMMQGDNKYKCSTCDTYVNAVKRACLKTVPDNVIFHLKRFDFDLMTGTRSKINDYFSFPMEIDMAPYNVEHLANTGRPLVPDQFRLVGIIVHSGTAEAGHYYSFIRERPGNRNSWIEMNDTDVKSFDPLEISHQCYGGWDGAWPKINNAYMLFYQRTTAMDSDAQTFPTELSKPVRTAVPFELTSRIAEDNQYFARMYCLADPSYIKFHSNLINAHQKLFEDKCSEDHKTEIRLIRETIKQLELVHARIKDTKQIYELLKSLERMTKRCVHCAVVFIRELCRPPFFRSLVFRCPHDTTRHHLASNIIACLDLVQEHDRHLYSGDWDSVSTVSSSESDHDGKGIMVELIQACASILDNMSSLNKGWDDYWAFIHKLASRGLWEASQIQEHQIFLEALKLVAVLGGLDCLSEWKTTLAAVMYKNKRGLRLAHLCKVIIRIINCVLDNDESKTVEDFYFTHLEANIIRYRAGTNSVLTGILGLNLPDNEVNSEIVVAWLQMAERDTRIDHLMELYYALDIGATRNAPGGDHDSWLVATLTFTQRCRDQGLISRLIKRYSEACKECGTDANEIWIEFFIALYRQHNQHMQEPHLFKKLVIRGTASCAVGLLDYNAYDDVQKRAADFFNRIIFSVDLQILDDEELGDIITEAGKIITEGCISRLQNIVHSGKRVNLDRLSGLRDIAELGVKKFYDDDTDASQAIIAHFQACLDGLPQVRAPTPDEVESITGYSDSDELTDTSLNQ